MTELKVAFAGLGAMGHPMAGHLARAGLLAAVWNRTHSKADALAAELKVDAPATIAEFARDCDVIALCVPADADVLALAHEIALHAREGTVVVDHSTVSSVTARAAAAALAERGCMFLDAPVSGGVEGAKNGKLSIMCGGSAEAMAKAEPLMQAYALRIVHIGEAGAGQTTKMVNQIAIAGVLQGLSEALRFAQASDLDLARVFEAISGGAAASWQMLNRWESMSEDRFDFGFAVDWMRKDLGLTLDEAKRNGAVLPLTALVDQFYAEVQKMGGGRNDTSSLVRRLPR